MEELIELLKRTKEVYVDMNRWLVEQFWGADMSDDRKKKDKSDDKNESKKEDKKEEQKGDSQDKKEVQSFIKHIKMVQIV